MGEGKREQAQRLFSMIVYISAAIGVVMALGGLLFLRPLAAALGADGQLLEDSVTYGRIILLAIPAYVLQYEFQCLFSVAEKPALGLSVTVAAGLTNILLDALFVAILHWGWKGLRPPPLPANAWAGLCRSFISPVPTAARCGWAGQNLMGGRWQSLCQRLFRTDEQYFHVRGQYAL